MILINLTHTQDRTGGQRSGGRKLRVSKAKVSRGPALVAIQGGLGVM